MVLSIMRVLFPDSSNLSLIIVDIVVCVLLYILWGDIVFDYTQSVLMVSQATVAMLSMMFQLIITYFWCRKQKKRFVYCIRKFIG